MTWHMRTTPEWAQLERLITTDTGQANEADRRPFRAADLGGAPEPVRRYFSNALSENTPLAPACKLAMRGQIKLNRWLPFRAEQLLAPRIGTVWVARVAGVISGSDRYVGGRGGMDWRLLGLLRLVHADGDDVSRSAAGRAAGESLWAPTALVPTDGVGWSALRDNHIAVDVVIDTHTTRVEHEIDSAGRVRSSRFDRWGDPDNDGSWGYRPFGLEVTAHRRFDGVTIPSAGRAGWNFGTDSWPAGVFFRYEITDYRLFP